MKNWRGISLLMIIWSGVLALLFIALIGSESQAAEDSATNVLILWAAGFALLSVLWFMWRPSPQPPRTCPRCGRSVPVGQLECEACGFDFRTIGS